MGQLIPVGVLEVLPGDTFQQRTSAMIRVSPLVAPTMHPVQVRIHHWFVPNRIIWDEWEEFITGGPDGNSNPAIPTSTLGTQGAKSLADYLGVPPVEDITFSNLPTRCYNKIYNEFYRDQDLVAEFGLDNNNIHPVAWEKDYFTSARPWPQKGDAITVPIGGQAPLVGIGTQDQIFGEVGLNSFETDGQTSYPFGKIVDGVGSGGQLAIAGKSATTGPDMYADLGKAEAVQVNDFRKAFALQRYQEARAAMARPDRVRT